MTRRVVRKAHILSVVTLLVVIVVILAAPKSLAQITSPQRSGRCTTTL